MSQVVGAELKLEVVRGELAGGRRHYAGIVDEEVHRPTLGNHAVGEGEDGCERRQVERPGRHDRVRHGIQNRAHGRRTLHGVAHRQHELTSGRRKPSCESEPDAVAGAGDHGELSTEVESIRVGNIRECGAGHIGVSFGSL
jgi:hypothetical protein